MKEQKLDISAGGVKEAKVSLKDEDNVEKMNSEKMFETWSIDLPDNHSTRADAYASCVIIAVSSAWQSALVVVAAGRQQMAPQLVVAVETHLLAGGYVNVAMTQ